MFRPTAGLLVSSFQRPVLLTRGSSPSRQRLHRDPLLSPSLDVTFCHLVVSFWAYIESLSRILGISRDVAMKDAGPTNGNIHNNGDVAMEDADANASKRKSRTSVGQRKSYAEPESSEDDQPLVRLFPETPMIFLPSTLRHFCCRCSFQRLTIR